MSGYRISDVADRTGFRPSTLRYYEQVGLLDPPERTAAGYRVYDDRAVARLSFVARAKSLGLSLEEIGELTALWEGDRCAPVQDRLRHLLTARRAAVQDQLAELVAFAGQLDAVARRLGEHTPTGPCDEACGCAAEPTEDVPLTCSLGPEDVPDRLAAWQAVLDRVVAREPVEGGVRLLFGHADALAGELAELAAAEQACCAFFDFSVRIAASGLALEVRAPDGATELVTALFG